MSEPALLPLIGETFDAGSASIHARFMAQSQRTPTREALVCGTVRYTYRALDEATNRVAHRLRKLGAERGRCVSLCLPRSAEMIVALFGILKSGAAYVPLLPESPAPRLAHQITETESLAVVTSKSLAPLVSNIAPHIVCLDDESLAGAPSTRLDIDDVRPDDDCYVIFTSGSTGLPKGVVVTHKNLANYTTSILRLLAFAPDEVWSAATVSTIAADLGHTALFPSLLSGGTLHVVDDVLDTARMAATSRGEGLDVLKITPSHLEALLASDDAADIIPRRVLFTGGEALRWSLVERVRGLVPDLRWYNHYGPTETTVGSTTYVVPMLDAERATPTIPIGRPVGNTRCYVLNEGKPVVAGGEGELFIAGEGVARGYLKRPELNRERFVPEPGTDGERRAYKTGDRVRLLEEGALEFIGRVDFQVKIRGHRVELGEIEHHLLAHEAIRESVVVARDTQTGPVLVAYVIASPPLETSGVRAFLATRMAEHMIPTHIVMLGALPLNPNGKVDRNALPAPGTESLDPGVPEEIRDDLEARLCAIWSDLLGRRIGVQDDFFQSGGTSLAALHLIARMQRELGTRVSHASLIRAATVAELASLLRRGETHHFSCLVPMQTEGGRQPLFLIHGGGGHVYFYRDLARHLGPDQPVYALQARVNDGLPPHETVEEMAEEYLRELRVLFPRGPYCLGGVSFGGKVALEIAQRLRDAGEEVALLAMFDTWGPGYPRLRDDVGRGKQALYWLVQRVEHHVGSLRRMDGGARSGYLREKANKALIETGEALQDLAKSAARRLRIELGQSELAELRGGQSYIRKASLAYVPKPYPDPVVMFRCTAQPLGIHYDRLMGWGEVLVGEIELHESPGLHAAMVAEPRSPLLAQKLRPILDRVNERYRRGAG